MKRLIISVLATLYTIFAFSANTKYDIKHLGNAAGLSNSSVNVIFQDNSTRMWFGTWDGLDLYDSESFRVYLPSAGNSSSIGNNVIRDIVAGPDSCLWVATDRGVDLYDPRTDSFERFFSETMRRSSISENSFHIAVNPAGETFVLVNGHGIFKYEAGTFNIHASLKGRGVVRAFFDASSNLWTHTDSGELYCNSRLRVSGVRFVFYDKRKDRVWIQDDEGFRDVDSPVSFKFDNGTITACDTDGSYYYIGSSEGVFRLDQTSGIVIPMLERVPVLSLHCGTQQILWVGSDMQGVWMLSDKLFDFGAVTGFSADNAVRCFARCGKDILVGTKGSGMYLFDKNLQQQGHFTVRDGLSHDAVFSLAGEGGLVWIGGDGRGISYLEKKPNRIRSLPIPDTLAIQSVYAILPEGKETLWVGTSGNGLFRLRLARTQCAITVVGADAVTESVLGSDIVYSIVPWKENQLLVGTRGGGISVVDTRTLSVEPLFGCENEDVLCVHIDSKGQIWAGTSMGIIFWDGLGKIKRYSLQEGMPSQTVHGILQDASGRIWASTNSGLACLDPETGYIITYRGSDGLQDNEFSDGAFFAAGDMFYFGGIKGFNRFDPISIHASGYQPLLIMKELRIDNEAVQFSADRLDLDPKVKSVSFTFTPIDYLSAERCMIAYRLEGIDKDWILIGNSRTVAFSNLAPGRYKLRVIWTDANRGICEGEWSLPLRMRQLWWQTPLAKTLFILLLFGIIYALLLQWQASKKVRTSHEAKLDFFTNIAHEFSNSLSLIYGPCQELKHSAGMSGAEMQYLHAIESNSDRMRSMIQQLINFRKAETGHLQISIGRVDVVALVVNVYDHFRDRMRRDNITFRMDAPPQGVVWTADGDSLEKVIFNLLSNAVKYTPSGQSVAVRLAPSQTTLEMDFTNYGIGIPKEKQASLFNRYDVLDRFERAIARGQTSNGIGLALCKSLVELHKGHIEIRSDGITYTTFHVDIPLLDVDGSQPVFSGSASLTQADEPDAVAADGESDADAAAGRECILVVDDDEQIRSFLKSVLSPRFKVMEASNGEQALKMMANREPKVVVSDLTMPVMDGVKLRQQMRQDKRLGHIPFILLTGKDGVETQIEALESGVDAYVAKPFHPRHLIARIDRLLNRDTEIIEYSRSAKSAVEQFAGKEMKKSDRSLLTSITEVIVKNMGNENLSVEMIADAVSQSKIQLYRKLKALVDMTPTEYIRYIRLNHAEHLLRTSDMSVQEIMYACGFVTKTYFYREFQKRFGMTPGELRRNVNDK